MKTWIVSDTHFGHENMYKFTDDAGNRVRPWAMNATEGDDIMRQKWNDRVKPGDRVYHLGDVAIPRRGLQMMSGLNGRKVLIRGNHDIFKMKDYAEHFDDLRGSQKLDNFILSHYPIHEESISHWCVNNIHGHTHGNLVLQGPKEWQRPDPRYTNVCVEHTAQAPIEFEELRAQILEKI